MSAAQHVISHPSDLDGLGIRPLPRLQPRSKIRLDMAGLSESDRLSWEKRLNRACRAGGSAEASMGFLVGLLLGAVVFVQAFADGHLGQTGATAVLAAIILPALIGKLVGVIKAQAQLRALVTDLQACWPQESDAAKDDD